MNINTTDKAYTVFLWDPDYSDQSPWFASGATPEEAVTDAEQQWCEWLDENEVEHDDPKIVAAILESRQKNLQLIADGMVHSVYEGHTECIVYQGSDHHDYVGDLDEPFGADGATVLIWRDDGGWDVVRVDETTIRRAGKRALQTWCKAHGQPVPSRMTAKDWARIHKMYPGKLGQLVAAGAG